MAVDLLHQAEDLASRNYSMAVYIEKNDQGQTLYLAENPELYGCMAEGNSLEEAIENLRDARIDYIQTMLEDRIDVPEPAAGNNLNKPISFASTCDQSCFPEPDRFPNFSWSNPNFSPSQQSPLYEAMVSSEKSSSIIV